MEPRCAAHPDRPAVGTCERCGAFSCQEDFTAVAGRWLCAGCAARPDADYLEAFRLKYWGKRDVWAWVMGLGALVRLVDIGLGVSTGSDAALPVEVPLCLCQACYFLGPRWARAFIFVPGLAGMIEPVLVGIARAPPGGLGLGALTSLIAQGIIALLPLTAIGLLILFNTRNMLFFRVEMSRARLKRAWDIIGNNAAARIGFVLSIVGLAVPGLGALGLVLSLIGRSRVDPGAFPPIGRKRQAVAGIVLGAIDTAGWAAFLAATR